MPELNTPAPMTATGGKVWAVPVQAQTQTAPPPQAFVLEAWEPVTRWEKLKMRLELWDITMLIFVFLVAILMACWVFPVYTSDSPGINGSPDSVFMEEYGYKDVTLNAEEGIADVIVAETGLSKEVKISNYDGAVILYETREQLEEKMNKVDAGTYSVSTVSEK